MKKLGLVLSSGALRGLAHIGAMQELEKMGASFSAIAGCSAGSVVGTFVAAGKSANEMEAMVRNLKTIQLFDASVSANGLQDTRAIKRIIETFIDHKTEFSELEIPLYINATNLKEGVNEVFSKGNIFEAIRASIAVPGIFAPAHIDGNYYADGALVCPAPFTSLHEVVDKMIIINTPMATRIPNFAKSNAVQIMRNGMGIMSDQLFAEQMKQLPKSKYLLIEPDVAEWPLFPLEKDFPKIIEAGRVAVLAKEKEIRKFLKK
jgi:NTE family protein